MKRHLDKITRADCFDILPKINSNSIHMILSDIPYGISFDKWDVIHQNKNSALLGSSPAQKKHGKVFKSRGKPLNGWSQADKNISKEYYKWCKKWAKHCLRILKPGGSIILFAGRRYAHRCVSALEDVGFVFKDMIAWQKSSAPHRAQRVSEVFKRRKDAQNSSIWIGWKLGNLRPIFEPILWLTKPYKIGTTLTDNIIKYNLGGYNEAAYKRLTKSTNNLIKTDYHKNKHHPTEKPLLLLKTLIRLVTRRNHIVLDHFAGSGSTLVAAKLCKRRFVGIEIDKEYIKTAKKRLRNEGSSRS